MYGRPIVVKREGYGYPPCNQTHHLLVCRAALEVTMAYNPKIGWLSKVIPHSPDSFEKVLRALLKMKPTES